MVVCIEASRAAVVVRVRAALALHESLVLLLLVARNACCTAAVVLRRLRRLQHDDGLFYCLAWQLLSSRDHFIKVAHSRLLCGWEIISRAPDGVEAPLGQALGRAVPLHCPCCNVPIVVVGNLLHLRHSYIYL